MGSISLNAPSYSSVGTTYATISCSAWDWPYPSDNGTSTSTGDTSNGTKTSISYSNTIWAWKFSDGGTASMKEPSYKFTGLSTGVKNTISATLTVTCTKTTTTTTYSTPEATESNPNPTTTTSTSTSSSAYTIGSASASQVVYTQPNSFSFGCSTGDYIADYATAANWNKLADQVGKYKSWRNQSDYYSSYNSLKVSSGDWITANVYNSMASACGTSSVTANSTLISAALFEALADAVSP